MRKRKILKSYKNVSGYSTVRLSKNNKVVNCMVHRLVAQAFITNSKNKPQVNHIDGDKTNNTADNLEWVTGKENTHHAYNTGLATSGEKKYNAKLTNEQVQTIREIYVSGDRNYGQRALAKRYNVNQRVIYNIVHNKSYKE